MLMNYHVYLQVLVTVNPWNRRQKCKLLGRELISLVSNKGRLAWFGQVERSEPGNKGQLISWFWTRGMPRSPWLGRTLQLDVTRQKALLQKTSSRKTSWNDVTEKRHWNHYIFINTRNLIQYQFLLHQINITSWLIWMDSFAKRCKNRKSVGVVRIAWTKAQLMRRCIKA